VSLLQYAAVRLFVERAEAVQPGFAVTQQNSTAVMQVCRRLDGIPLALELAAARLRGLSAEQLAARLDKRFRVLRGGSRAALPRHQTLQALVDWSYGLLTAAEQRVFDRLAVFTGGFTLEAAEAVCAGGAIAVEDVLDALLRLVEKSLVIAEAGRGEVERYRLLETLREYAWERLAASGEDAAAHDRHAQYFLNLAENAEPELHGPQQIAWLDRLELEHDNLRAALGWCLRDEGHEGHEISAAGDAAGEDGSGAGIGHVEDEGRYLMGLRLAGALGWFWDVHVHFREGLQWLERALARSKPAGALVQAQARSAAAARAKALTRAATLGDCLGQFGQKRELLVEGIALYRALDDRRGLAWSLIRLGTITQGLALHETRDPADRERGTALLEEGLALAREVGDPWLIACALSFLADTEHARGEAEKTRALAAAEESLALYQEMGHIHGSATAQRALGWAAMRRRDFARAEAAFAAYVAAMRALASDRDTALGLSDLGDAAQEQGDYARAAAYYEQSVGLYRDLGVLSRWNPGVLRDWGHVVLELGDHARARTCFEECLAIGRELENQWQIADALEALASVAAAQGDQARALRLAGAAAAVRERAGQLPSYEEERASPARWLAAARAALDEQAQMTAWWDGQAMSLQQAVAYATEDLAPY
jgi:non-specific serine/threonine protein kinase